jgi:hypothetical protein
MVTNNSSTWMSPTNEWLTTEFALWGFVMLAFAASLCVGRRVAGVRSHAQWALLAMAVVPITTYAVQYARTPGAIFEAGFYNAMLLPLPLLAVTTFATTRIETAVRGTAYGPVCRSAGGASILLSTIFVAVGISYILIGRLMPVTGIFLAAFLATGIAASPIVVRLLTQPGALPQTKRAASLLVLAALISPLAMQALAGARPTSGSGLFAQPRYTLAPDASRGVETLARTNYAVQAWLLGSVSPEDKIAVVAIGPNPMVSAAAMQLWGPNTIYFPASQQYPVAAQLGTPPVDVIAFYGMSAKICGLLAREYAQEMRDAHVLRTTSIQRGGWPVDVCLIKTHR